MPVLSNFTIKGSFFVAPCVLEVDPTTYTYPEESALISFLML